MLHSIFFIFSLFVNHFLPFLSLSFFFFYHSFIHSFYQPTSISFNFYISLRLIPFSFHFLSLLIILLHFSHFTLFYHGFIQSFYQTTSISFHFYISSRPIPFSVFVACPATCLHLKPWTYSCIEAFSGLVCIR